MSQTQQSRTLTRPYSPLPF